MEEGGGMKEKTGEEEAILSCISVAFSCQLQINFEFDWSLSH
jgi:hypothetical protein